MPVQIDVTPILLRQMESELAKPCDCWWHDWKCDKQATWAMWSAHSLVGCPGEYFACNDCKQRTIDCVTEAVTRTMVCMFCRHKVTGQVSDNVRMIEL